MRFLVGQLGQPDKRTAADDIERLPQIWDTLQADYAEQLRLSNFPAPVGPAATEALRANVQYQKSLRGLDSVFAAGFQKLRDQGYFRGSGLGCSTYGRDGLGLAPLVAVAIVAAAAAVAVAAVIALSDYLAAREAATIDARSYVDVQTKFLDLKTAHPEIEYPSPMPPNRSSNPSGASRGGLIEALSPVVLVGALALALFILPKAWGGK